MTSTNDVIARLTHEFPEFQPMLEERSRHENLGELLPLVVLSDIADWAVEQPGSNIPRVTQLLATLEREYAQADEVHPRNHRRGVRRAAAGKVRTRRSDRQPAGSAAGRGGDVAGSVPVSRRGSFITVCSSTGGSHALCTMGTGGSPAYRDDLRDQGSVADRFPVEGQPVGEQRVEVIAGDAFRERDEVLGPDVPVPMLALPRP